MKAKEEEEVSLKMKRTTSSHLNEIFMKNKKKIKPISFIRNANIVKRKWEIILQDLNDYDDVFALIYNAIYCLN